MWSDIPGLVSVVWSVIWSVIWSVNWSVTCSLVCHLVCQLVCHLISSDLFCHLAWSVIWSVIWSVSWSVIWSVTCSLVCHLVCHLLSSTPTGDADHRQCPAGPTVCALQRHIPTSDGSPGPTHPAPACRGSGRRQEHCLQGCGPECGKRRRPD